MTSVFSDSTTLLYPLDRSDPTKQAACAGWLKTLRDRDLLTLSPQVLNETYWVATRKPAFAWARSIVRTYVLDHAAWTTAPFDTSVLAAAFEIIDRYAVGFWDALLLASANAASCAYFLSEDLNDGQAYGATRVINPFRHAPADVLGPGRQP